MNEKNTALLLIDLQKESQFGITQIEDIKDKTSELIGVCRKKNVPVIFTRQINRADNRGLSNGEPLTSEGEPKFYNSSTEHCDILEGIDVREEDLVIDKYRWSAFHETPLDLMLRNMGIKHLIVGGFVTDGCVMTSVFDAYFRDYQIHLVKDICSTTNEGAHMSSIMIMANWIYDMTIYNSAEMVKRLNNSPYQAWIGTEPDSLKFTPETMRTVFNNLDLS
ncbi:Nicotinamidase-related amidase [Salipaludibacillus aurantiacus]|uniref:Nicotinamidase-related amidase n=1 Tax=Salipaludibacillus aurantiacus TaxID=1601833 RepID=A0A1H9TW90_9BACI|nr:isochorismatase family cysteine hydrolase [Salipaludibacillus aurantiacus]SES01244.1 Nicotinamidase-related amidase [Salipaludibacillus aurantiacus]